MKRCTSKTKSGNTCRAPAMIGMKRCLFHNKAVRWTGRQVQAGTGRYVREKTYRTIKRKFK